MADRAVGNILIASQRIHRAARFEMKCIEDGITRNTQIVLDDAWSLNEGSVSKL